MKTMLLGISVGMVGLTVAIALNGIIGVIIAAFGLAFAIVGYKEK